MPFIYLHFTGVANFDFFASLAANLGLILLPIVALFALFRH